MKPSPTASSKVDASAFVTLEQELEHRAKLMETIVEASHDGLCILDAQGRFLGMNAAFERITGLRRTEWIGRPRADLKGEPGITHQSAMAKAVKEGRPASTLVRLRHGQMLLVTATPHFGPDGDLRNVILNLRNISELNDLKHELETERAEIRAAARDRLAKDSLASELEAAGFGDLVATSPSMREVLQAAVQLAKVDATVLISGETGVGKGMFAGLIHRLSDRSRKPLIDLNCGAIPESLIESELFGYEAGAFTGAQASGKKGQLELADGGTVFLDEIGELPLTSQTKLLKFLDDKVIRRVGGTHARAVDVRILAATNRNLRELVAAGAFRADLLYRLEVIPLSIPPLRERPSDIEALALRFLEQFNREFGGSRSLGSEAVALLCRYPYEGNVRELKNLIARLVLTAKESEITVHDFPPHVREVAAGARTPGDTETGNSPQAGVALKDHLERVERAFLERHARECRTTYEIAERVGVHQSSIARKLRKYGISVGGTD